MIAFLVLYLFQVFSDALTLMRWGGVVSIWSPQCNLYIEQPGISPVEQPGKSRSTSG